VADSTVSSGELIRQECLFDGQPMDKEMINFIDMH